MIGKRELNFGTVKSRTKFSSADKIEKDVLIMIVCGTCAVQFL